MLLFFLQKKSVVLPFPEKGRRRNYTMFFIICSSPQFWPVFIKLWNKKRTCHPVIWYKTLKKWSIFLHGRSLVGFLKLLCLSELSQKSPSFSLKSIFHPFFVCANMASLREALSHNNKKHIWRTYDWTFRVAQMTSVGHQQNNTTLLQLGPFILVDLVG